MHQLHDLHLGDLGKSLPSGYWRIALLDKVPRGVTAEPDGDGLCPPPSGIDLIYLLTCALRRHRHEVDQRKQPPRWQ